MQLYPDVPRFVFEAGRAATARKDYAEARRLYDQAAAAGYVMALNNIGIIYEGGEGELANYCRGGALVPEGGRRRRTDRHGQSRLAV